MARGRQGRNGRRRTWVLLQQLGCKLNGRNPFEKPDKTEFIVWPCLTILRRMSRPWTSCRACGFSPGSRNWARSLAPRTRSTCPAPWRAATWPSSKSTSAPASSTAPRARYRYRPRARYTSNTANASWPRSTQPMTSCASRAIARRESSASTCPWPSASTCCCLRSRVSRSATRTSRSKSGSTIVTWTSLPSMST